MSRERLREHGVANLADALHVALSIFERHPGHAASHAAKLLVELDRYTAYPFHRDEVREALAKVAEGRGTDTQSVISVLERAIADLPELMPPASVPRAPEGCGWNILVVDDDEDFVAVITAQIAGLCSDARIRRVAPADLVASVTDDTDMVLLDLYDRMYFIGGRLLAQLSASVPGVPIVVCTGDHRPETAWQMVRLGAAGVLTKPIDESALQTITAAALSRRIGMGLHRPPAPEISDPSGTLPALQRSEMALAPAVLPSLLRMLAPAAEKVEVVGLLEDGKSGAAVLRVRLGNDSDPTIVKLRSDEELLRERERYLRHVRGTLSNLAGRIDRPAALFFDRSRQGDRATWSAIAYSFAGRPGGGDLLTLAALFERAAADADDGARALTSLRTLIEDVLPIWYRRAEVAELDPRRALAQHLGPALEVRDARFVPLQTADAIHGRVEQMLFSKKKVLSTVRLRERGTGQFVSLKLAADPGLWLRPGREVAAVGTRVPDPEYEKPAVKAILDALTGARVLQAPVIHGDLNPKNVMVQRRFPEWPWLIDFAFTGPGLPLWDMVKLEADLVLHVFLHQVAQRAAGTELDVCVAGRPAPGLPWIDAAIRAIREAAQHLHEPLGLEDVERQITLLRGIYAHGARRWYRGKDLAIRYLDACTETAAGALS